MSSFDAAPLPRLGEVFFDVRGDSRSMRLSWYSDTGVAVFSIWQGGRCSGTFRLPVDDLARMVETLRRGPDVGRPEPGQSAGAGEPGPRRDYDDPDGFAPDRPGRAADDAATGYLTGPASGSYESDFPTDYPPPGAARPSAERPSGAEALGFPPPVADYGPGAPGFPPAADRPGAGDATGFPPPVSGYDTGAPDINPDDPLGLGLPGSTAAGHPGRYSPGEHAEYGDRPEPGARREPARHPEPGGFPEPGGSPRREAYPEAAAYPDRRGYPEPGGYPEADGYAEPEAYPDAGGFPEPGGRLGPAGYPRPASPYEQADAGRTDPGAAVGAPPDYRRGQGHDYRRADTPDYLTRDGRNFTAADDRDYLPGGIAPPAADDPAADRYRSRGGSDSGAHSPSRRWVDDQPDTDGVAYRAASLEPGGDPRLATEFHGRDLSARPGSGPPQAGRGGPAGAQRPDPDDPADEAEAGAGFAGQRQAQPPQFGDGEPDSRTALPPERTARHGRLS